MLSTGLLMWGYVLLAYITISHPTPFIVGIIATLIHNLSPFLLRWPGSVFLASHSLIAAGMIHQASFAYYSGSFLSPILIWFGILPMLGGVTDGLRGVIIWFISTSTVSLYFFSLYFFDN